MCFYLWFVYFIVFECRKVVDIVFIVDFFGSIGKMNWEWIKWFLKRMVSKLDIGFFIIYVVVIIYSINFEIVLCFNIF